MLEVADPNLAERKRKERERMIIKEGTELWKLRKLREAQEKREEQRKLQAMLANYHPWGRPGGGAPNLDVRRKPLSLTHVDTNKGLEGGGLVGKVGPKPPIYRRSDPMLRYQFHEPVRRSIDNHVRYRRPFQEQVQYKQQLDRLVAEKRRLLAEERREENDLWNMSLTTQAPWGRPGPGGGQWREPSTIGMNFLHSLVPKRGGQASLLSKEWNINTWSRMSSECRLQGNQLRPNPEEVLTGGVELVPLLARRRAGYKRRELASTDVTRLTNGPAPKPLWKPAVNEREYLRELTTQIINKEMKMKEARCDDIVRSKRHFETWGGFWGRPGHGAPKGTLVKENLEYLLYRMPVATM